MQQPEKISRYIIEKILGRGAAGTVYKAYDPIINQTVAIKVLHKQLLDHDDSGEQLHRFRNEVLAGRRLKHKNIVSIYEYGEEGESAFIVMEFIAGKQLKDYLDGTFKFDLATIHTIMQQLLAALNYAHEQDIVHRDIKPANIMVMEQWQIQVADFGIAKIDSSSLTQTGMLMGTPSYMSPEQCEGKHNIDRRSDIFSAGVLFYHLLTGKRPFDGGTMMSTIQQVLNITPVNPSQLNQSISPALDKVIAKALAKNPEDRFQTADAFSEAITQAFNNPNDNSDDDSTVAIPNDATVVMSKNTTLDTNRNENVTPKTYSNNNKPSQPKNPKTSFPVNTSVKPKNNRWLIVIGIGLLATGAVFYLFNRSNNINPLNEVLAKYPCAYLTNTTEANGNISLQGYMSAQDLQQLKTDLTQLPNKDRINIQAVQAWENTFCSVLEILSPFKVAANTNNLQVFPGKQDAHYITDDYLDMTVTLPNYDSYLYVDYFQLNGHVLHMFPNKSEHIQIHKAQNNLPIGQMGDEKRWQIAPPYGVEMVSVIASSTALFKELRSEDELTDSYLQDLKTVITDNNAKITVQYFSIETSQ